MEFRRVLFRSLDRGARTLVGGAALPRLGESFHQPTVLVGVGPDALVNRKETFGPLAAIIRFDTEAEAIRIANDTASGVAAYLYTSDPDRQARVSEELEYGMVSLNTAMNSSDAATFGGVKE